MNVPGALAEIRGHIPLDHFTVNVMPLAIHLQYTPYMPRDSNFLTDRRRCDNRSDLLGLTANRVLLVFLKDTVKAIGLHDALPCQPDDQAAALRPLDMLLLQEMAQERAIVLLRHARENRQCEHPFRQCARRELSTGGEGAHRLMIEEAERETMKARRLHPALLKIELDQGYALQEFPRDRRRQESACIGNILAHDKVHLLRLPAPPRSSHALEEG